MLPIETLRTIQTDHKDLVDTINQTLAAAEIDAIVAPAGINLWDLEKYRDCRRRMTGTLLTDDLASFDNYITTLSADRQGTRIFVHPDSMTAACVINFGSNDEPGHCDHLAKFAPEATAQYKALMKVAKPDTGRITQKGAAEWCEDYSHSIEFLGADNETIEPAKAIKAIRNIKVEHSAKAQSGVGNFSSEKSLLESTKVDTSEGLPHYLAYTCAPRAVLSERKFVIRLGVGANAGETVFTMQIVRFEQHIMEMAQELADIVREKMGSLPVLIGSFVTKQ
jgi:uncharacterized protein YfdQ (DUF2303 family)